MLLRIQCVKKGFKHLILKVCSSARCYNNAACITFLVVDSFGKVFVANLYLFLLLDRDTVTSCHGVRVAALSSRSNYCLSIIVASEESTQTKTPALNNNNTYYPIGTTIISKDVK